MLFKSAQIYTLTAPFALSAEELAQAMEPDNFKPCGSLAPQSYGWVPPLGRHSEYLVNAVSGRILVCARKEEKIMPPATIKEEVNERALAIEEQEGRSVGRKERLQLKDDVILSLIPRAFTKSKLTYAYIDTKNGWIIVDATSAKQAEELLSLLRQGVGSLSVRPLSVKRAPSTVMTEWLNGKYPRQWFEPLQECELRDPVEDGGIVKCKHQDLFCEEVEKHLIAGKQVTKLALSWKDRVSFLLSDDLSIKRIKFDDIVTEELDHIDGDQLAQIDATFAIMTLEFEKMIPQLIVVMGGAEMG